jgi:hypothetical protein
MNTPINNDLNVKIQEIRQSLEIQDEADVKKKLVGSGGYSERDAETLLKVFSDAISSGKTNQEILDALEDAGLDILNPESITDVLDSVFINMSQAIEKLEDKLQGIVDKIGVFSGKIELIVKLQNIVSERMKGMDADSDAIPLFDSPETSTFTFSKTEIENSSSLKALVDELKRKGSKGITFSGDDVKFDVKALLPEIAPTLKPESLDGEFNLGDFRRLSENLSNQVKLHNDETQRLSTEYESVNNDLNTARNVISKILEKAMDAFRKIIGNWA